MSEDDKPIFPRSMDDDKELNDFKKDSLELCIKVITKLNNFVESEKVSNEDVYRLEKSYHRKIQSLLNEVYEIEKDLEQLLSPIEMERESSAVYGPPPMTINDNQSNSAPRIVVCQKCGARFAEGIKFCGACGNSDFTIISSPYF